MTMQGATLTVETDHLGDGKLRLLCPACRHRRLLCRFDPALRDGSVDHKCQGCKNVISVSFNGTDHPDAAWTP